MMFSQSYMSPKPQANAVRAYLEMYDGVEPSWSDEWKRYEDVNIAEWHNGRERGYVVMFTNPKREQLNIAFFEHRNSDEICALAWVQSTINPPTIESAKFGDIYKDKYDVSHSVGVGQAKDMADWIYEQLCVHWSKA
jgi:hypothetical protein